MNILAIDTTSTGLSIALVKNGEIFSYTKEIGKSGHSATLMPSVKEMLDTHNVAVDDLDAIGVVVGPGSFTGIRIGVSAMTLLRLQRVQNASQSRLLSLSHTIDNACSQALTQDTAICILPSALTAKSQSNLLSKKDN